MSGMKESQRGGVGNSFYLFIPPSGKLTLEMNLVSNRFYLFVCFLMPKFDFIILE